MSLLSLVHRDIRDRARTEQVRAVSVEQRLVRLLQGPIRAATPLPCFASGTGGALGALAVW